MCEIEFIVVSDAPYGVCQYVMARFVIFCFFFGCALIYGLCTLESGDNPGVINLLCIALALEFLAIFLACFYVAFAVVIATELVCTMFTIFCCCCVFPLVNRAARRRRLSFQLDSFLISTTLVGVACNETCVICCGISQGRVMSDDMAPSAAEVPVTSLGSVKSSTIHVLSMARGGMSIV